MPKKVANPEVDEQVNVEVAHQMLDVDIAVERRLVALYTLQLVDSEIDKIQIIRGELPQAIQDLEDELAGLNTRIEKFKNDIADQNENITKRNNEIVDHEAMIKKYEKQQENVRNNREYEAINKEIEFQNLEIQLCQRKNRDASNKIKELEQHIEAAELLIEGRQSDLNAKKEELDSIIEETKKDEVRLTEKSAEMEQFIDERYLTAYKRIRRSARNGLAVVTIDRDACGGCFSKIPPQRQSEIKMHKKVIVCEHCGRIVVDNDISCKAHEQLEK
ncbi:MAG: C4-type zinc ribbon domain-containing protein [Bacteroidales bacterium]|nr:C4-type zinc ribbon domain-containing protein [Bacteroidales bacterium]